MHDFICGFRFLLHLMLPLKRFAEMCAESHLVGSTREVLARDSVKNVVLLFIFHFRLNKLLN